MELFYILIYVKWSSCKIEFTLATLVFSLVLLVYLFMGRVGGVTLGNLF